MLKLIENILSFWTQNARRGGVFIALLFIIGGIGAGWYAATHLKVNTDTTQMLAADLPFQEKARELRESFPQIRNELAIIIRAPTQDELDAYSARLYSRLQKRDDIITALFSPKDELFFQENGLMFLSEKELEQRLSNLTKASGLIEKLINDPGIDTLFATLAENDALASSSDLGEDSLNKIYGDLAKVISENVDGRPTPFSWRGALTNENAPDKGFLQILNVTPITDFTRLQPIKSALAGLRTEINTLNTEFDGRTSALITGNLALRGEELETVSNGIGKSFLLSFIMVTLLLMVAFRSLYTSILTIIGLLITLTLTSAFAAFVFVELNLVSVAFTVLLIGLGLDFSIHLLLHIQEHRGKGSSLPVALKSTMREVGSAMVLAAPTTALAFFSFLPTSFDGIAQLGAVAGVGVLVAFFVSVTFLPAALAVVPAPRPRPAKGTVRKSFSWFEPISTPIAVIVTIVGLAAITLLPQARFDADPMALRSQKSESVIAFNMLFEDDDTVPYRLTRLVNSQEEAIATAEQVKGLDTVRSTRSLVDFVPQDQDEKLDLIDFASGSLAFVLDKSPTPRTTPPTGESIDTFIARLKTSINDQNQSGSTTNNSERQNLLNALQRLKDIGQKGLLEQVEKQIFAYWPNLVTSLQKQFNADYIEYDTLPENLVERYKTIDGKWRVDLLPAEDVRIPQKLKSYVNSVEEVFPDIGGGAIHSQRAGEIIALSMMQASGLAVIIITLFLLIFVRQVVTVLLMLFPLALAAILTIATGVLVNVPFNYANVIVLPLLMGIGVDSGIHLVMRQQKVAGSEMSIYATATPRAVLFSAFTTVASFGSLMLSDHRGIASMGQLLSIAIAYTLICTLIVLPAVFRFRANRQQKV